ncbi:NYN domain-containing protein, partial [Bradyrhizobium jicamae]|nr:NYN domain-containing protein [Bradyrhizobium jicamae]
MDGQSGDRPVRQCHFCSLSWAIALSDRIAIFVDGLNLHASARALGFEIDYGRLLERFKGQGALVRAFYYAAPDEQEYSSIRPLIDWLEYNGYSVVKRVNRGPAFGAGGRKPKSGMEIDLVVNAMELAAHLDQMVLFSGDGGFRRLVEAVQRRGVRVTVVSTVASRPTTTSDDLRRQADAFIDLADLRLEIARRVPS